MKVLPLLLLYFYFGFFKISVTTGTSVPCESNDENIVWKCVQNQDETLNITIDCSLNKINKNSAEIRIWSSQFPIQLKALTIQNCDKLTVNTSCNAYKDMINFSHLEIRDISNLILGGREETKVNSTALYDYYYYSYRPPKKTIVNDGLLPTFTSLQNIQNATFTSILVSSGFKNTCQKENYVFKSLEIKNVNLNHLKQDFIGYSSNLTNFIMDNVTILSVKSEILEQTSIITINSTVAMVKIVNSKLPDLNIHFMNCTASEVILSGNKFEQLKGYLRTYSSKAAFLIKTNKFSLIGNTIPLWETYSFKIESPIINISNNTFEDIEDFSADFVIKLPSKNVKPHYSYTFKNNIIHTLGRRTFSYKSWGGDFNPFDFFDLSNNFINCSCGTFLWFDYMAMREFDSMETHVQLSKWFNSKNNNRCLNLPNCTLNQVLHNFEKLCDEDYSCVETVPYNLKNTRLVYNDLINTVHDIAKLNSKMLAVMSNGKYTEQATEQNQNNEVERKNELNEVERKNQFSEVDAGELSHNDFPYMKEMYSCLILISCLCFIMFVYQALGTYKKCSSRIHYLSKRRTPSESEFSL